MNSDTMERIPASDIEEGDAIQILARNGKPWGDGPRPVESIEEDGGIRILRLGGDPFESPLGDNKVRVRRLGQDVLRAR